MRVDLVVGGGTVKESLALLPIATGRFERFAGCIDFLLRQRTCLSFRVKGLAGVIESLRIVGQTLVGGKYNIIDVSVDNALHDAVVVDIRFLLIVTARHKAQAESSQEEQPGDSFSFFHFVFCFILECFYHSNSLRARSFQRKKPW